MRRVALALLPALAALAAPSPAEDFLREYRAALAESDRVRQVQALGASGDPRGAEALGKAFRLERNSPYLQAWILKTLCDGVGTPDALKRVAEVLRDPRLPPSAALVAQRALADVRNPEGLAWMAKEGVRDGGAGEAMAWGLAWNAGFRDATAFEARLAPKAEKRWRVRAAAAWGLRRIGDPRSAPALLTACSAEVAAPVKRLLLSACGAVDCERALPLLETALADPDDRIRLGAVEGLSAAARDGACRSRALGLLADALARETGRLRSDIARALEAATGRKLGMSATAWKAVLESRPAPGTEEAVTRPPAEYYGLKLPSRRIVILVESSREMSWDRHTLQAVDRLDRAKREAAKLIDALPDGTAFSVVSFGSSGSRWKETLAEASEETRKSAKAWVAAIGPHGWPDYGSGLRKAWELGGRGAGDPPKDFGADTIVLVGNGEPLWGDLPTASDLLRWVLVEGRTRSVVIHTVGIGSATDKTFLTALAAQTGGTFRNVD